MSTEHWLKLIVVSGVEGPSIYLDDFRIAGPKPWGGGKVLYEFKVSAEGITGVLERATPAARIGGYMTSDLADELRELFQDEEARYSYAESSQNAFVAAQIKALREDRQMSQEEVAVAIGTKQPAVSRLENANYSSWRVETLRKLARVYGVRLDMSFKEFGTLIPQIENLQKNLYPRKFEDDPAFKDYGTASEPTKKLAMDQEEAFARSRARLLPKLKELGITFSHSSPDPQPPPARHPLPPARHRKNQP
jgi:transcriptional regulator with XRE-family HTH domain